MRASIKEPLITTIAIILTLLYWRYKKKQLMMPRYRSIVT